MNTPPLAKAYQTNGGEDEFFHEVANFLLEVGFVSPRFYCMPKKRVGFIITTYEGEKFDWGLLTAEALKEKVLGAANRQADEADFCTVVVGAISNTYFRKPTGGTKTDKDTNNSQSQKASTTRGMARRRIDTGR